MGDDDERRDGEEPRIKDTSIQVPIPTYYSRRHHLGGWGSPLLFHEKVRQLCTLLKVCFYQ
jgi:hypothetical protein